MLNALTVDVEDWYHICAVETKIKPQDWQNYESRVEKDTNKILAILREADVKATFFILGYIAERYPNLISSISKEGHELATHGFGHNLVYRQDESSFKDDLIKSIAILENIIKNKIIGHRAASFSITKDSLWALEILSLNGIRYDCSIFPIRHPRYGIKDAPRFPYKINDSLMEFPPSTISIFGRNIPVAGGAYLRLLPYWFIRYAITKINGIGKPAHIYIHPWELDDSQPKLDIPFSRKFTHYANLKTTEYKLKMLLNDFKFGTVKDVLNIE